MGKVTYGRLWTNITAKLDQCFPSWRANLTVTTMSNAVKDRNNGKIFNNAEIWEGIVKAVLSNSTDWSNVEPLLPELKVLFHNFDISFYASLTTKDIKNDDNSKDDFITWFESRKAGSLTLRQGLERLIETAKKLEFFIKEYGSLETFFQCILKQHNNDTVLLVYELGSSSSPYKLPGLGIPLSAEAMRNIGFDVSKPDRHIKRAIASFGLLNPEWKETGDYAPPEASDDELIQVMRCMEYLAKNVNQSTSFIDTAIWLLCANSGCHLKNNELRDLAKQTNLVDEVTPQIMTHQMPLHWGRILLSQQEASDYYKIAKQSVCKVSLYLDFRR